MTTHTDDSGTDTFHVYVVPAKDWEPGTMRPVVRGTDMVCSAKITVHSM